MKTMRSIIQTITLLLLIAACLHVGRVWERAVATENPDQLPSIMDIQRQIGAKPDGVLGKETQRLWDEAYCNQCAEVYFK